MGVYATHAPSVPPLENCPLPDPPTRGSGGICRLVTPGTPRSHPDVQEKEPRGAIRQEDRPSSVTARVEAPQALCHLHRSRTGRGK